MKNVAQGKTNEKLEQFQHVDGKRIVDVLGEANRLHLKGKGRIMLQPIMDDNLLCWTLAWTEDPVSFDLNVVVHLENIGGKIQGRRVLVHRHAAAPYSFEGHMPRTRMRRLNGFSITAIKQAVQGEFVQDEYKRIGITKIGSVFVRL